MKFARPTPHSRTNPERWSPRTRQLAEMKDGDTITLPSSAYGVTRCTCQRFNDVHAGESKWTCKKEPKSETFTITRNKA